MQRLQPLVWSQLQGARFGARPHALSIYRQAQDGVAHAPWAQRAKLVQESIKGSAL
jgi:hypothetical protein